MKNLSSLAEGKRALPGVLCGLAGGLIVAGLWVLEYTVGVDLLLKEWYQAREPQLTIEHVCPHVVVLAASVVLAFIVSWVVLDCRGFLRQSFVILLVLIVFIGTSLSAALFGWLLNPLLPLVAVSSSGLLAMLYALQHNMPCDRGISEQSEGGESLTEVKSKTTPTRHMSVEVPSESAEHAKNDALSQSVEKVMMPFPAITAKVGEEHGKD